MIGIFFRKYGAVSVCFVVALFLLGKMLASGYILTYDMVWTPYFSSGWSADTPNNAYLLHVLLHSLSLIVPSWVVQKFFLVALFFLLFFIPYRFLPFIEGVSARMFAVGIYALNPFVYSRILAGQWFHLFAYALLPFLIFALVRLTEKPDRRGAVRLFLALFFIGLFSVHFLYIAVLLSGFWVVTLALHARKNGDMARASHMVRFTLLAIGVFLVVNAFWIVPALLRSAPLEARFDEAHFDAFAAAGNGSVSVFSNVAVLGGFWGEALTWRYYFAWPQEENIFWMAVFTIVVFICLGVWHLVSQFKTRFVAWFLVSIGIIAYITALGTAQTPFRSFNLFLYHTLPFWKGLRDSHKIAGVLALVYAVFSGVGMSVFLSALQKRNKQIESFLSFSVLALPVITGMYMWGGMRGQLSPVWYPSSWYEAKTLIDQMPREEKVLVLPWHLYLSLDFAGNRIVANPAEAFFGSEHIVAGRSVEIGRIYDQEVDTGYRDIDRFVSGAGQMSREELLDGLRERGITQILIITNSAIPHADEGLTRWTHFSAEIGDGKNIDEEPRTWTEMLPDKEVIRFSDNSLVLMKIYP